MAKATINQSKESKNVNNNGGDLSDQKISEKMKNIQNKFEVCYNKLNMAMIERSEEIKICLTSLIAGEHPLLIGPPGTAKSLLIDSLMKWISSGKKFSALMGKFTTPEELFGTVDLVKLTHDRIYTRNTTGQLPEADLAFLDEIFLSSSAVLNTLLKVLNERTWRNTCGTEIKIPLLMCLAAGNHFPQAGELNALYDRFLMRKRVQPISSQQGRKYLLFGQTSHDVDFDASEQITREEILSARKLSQRMQWSDIAKNGLLTIWREINNAGIKVGDRRMFKTRNAIQAFAFMNGHSKVELKDLMISCHSLWEDPNEQPEKVLKIVAKIADPGIGQLKDIKDMYADLVNQYSNPNVKADVFEIYKKAEVLKKRLEKYMKENDEEDSAEVRTLLKEIESLVKETGKKFAE